MQFRIHYSILSHGKRARTPDFNAVTNWAILHLMKNRYLCTMMILLAECLQFQVSDVSRAPEQGCEDLNFQLREQSLSRPLVCLHSYGSQPCVQLPGGPDVTLKSLPVCITKFINSFHGFVLFVQLHSCFNGRQEIKSLGFTELPIQEVLQTSVG